MKTIKIDASGKILGRLAVEIALVLRGKDEPGFAPHKESGNIVIVENADKIVMTGAKLSQKKYFSHSGYPKGARTKTVKEVFSCGRGAKIERLSISSCFVREASSSLT